MTRELPAPSPPVTPETEPFWEATAAQRLLLRECDACGRVSHYPRARCPDCLADAVTWIEASGRGTIYSYTVTQQAQGDYAEATPYVLAYVELEEGPRIMTNVVGVDPDEVRVGQSVEIRFDDTDDSDDEYALVRFTPV